MVIAALIVERCVFHDRARTAQPAYDTKGVWMSYSSSSSIAAGRPKAAESVP